MTDGELHEVSQSIGRLQGEVADMRADQNRMRDILHNINNKLTVLMHVQEKVQSMEPAVEDYKRMKQRVIGAAAFVGTAFGLLGSWIHTHLLK